MADREFNIRVRVDPSGARQGARDVEESLGCVEARADRLGKTIGRALTTGLAAFAVRQAVDIADRYARLEAQLGTLPGSADNARASLDRLTDVAQRTGTSVEGTVRQFALLRNATLDLGIADDRLADLLASYRGTWRPTAGRPPRRQRSSSGWPLASRAGGYGSRPSAR